MKNTLFLFIALFLTWNLSAQNVDGGAGDLLKAVSNKYQSYTSMQFHYTLKATKESKTLSTSQGDFAIKGDKYRTTYNGQSFFCDGDGGTAGSERRNSGNPGDSQRDPQRESRIISQGVFL